MDFWRVAAILNKRKWFIMLSVLVGTTLTFGATRLIGSTWTATVQFVVPINSGVTVNAEGMGSENASATSLESAKSQAIIYSAIVKSSDVLRPSLSEFNQAQLPADLLKNIEFSAVSPRFYQLQVTDSSISRSEKLANALAENFLKAYQKVRTAQAQKAVDMLEDQMRAAETRLAAARQKYDAYRDSHHIVGTLSATFDAILSRYREARQRRDEAQRKIADATARLNHVKSEMKSLPSTVSVPVVSEPSPEVKHLQEQVAQADNQVTEYRAKYNETNPLIAKATADRAALALKLQAAEKKLQSASLSQANPARSATDLQVRMLSQEIAGYQALSETLNKDIAQAQHDLDQYKGVDSPLGVLASDVASQTDLRANLAMRLRSAHSLVDSTATQDSLTIMDAVSDYNPPVNVSKGKGLKMVAIGALCSLIAMCGLVIGMDSLDRRVRTVKEAEIVLPAPIIAAIPQPVGAVTYASLARVTQLHPQSIHSESYRFLGLHLLSLELRHVRSLMMLAAKAEQGSTTTLTNLGITLAQAGKRVIIVDANIRTAELHQVFEIENEYGYTDLLQTPIAPSLKRALHQTSIPNLQIITSGPQPANPWELFRSPAVVEVAQQLESIADYVLYDTPSSVVFTDALNLAPVVDAAFLCVRALERITGGEDRLVKQLKEAHVPVLGCVLTDVPIGVVEGFRNYQHYYGPVANNAALEAGLEKNPGSRGNDRICLPNVEQLGTPADGEQSNII